jgi:hypothetical protein
MKRILFSVLAITALYACNGVNKKDVKLTEFKMPDSATATPVTAVPVSVPDTLHNASNDTIAAGKSIGYVSIGEKMELVTAELGTPDDGDAAMGKALSIWRSKPSGKGADTVSHTITIFSTTNFGDKDEVPRVQNVRITSPFFKTAEMIKCGSTLAFIKLQYPAVKKPIAAYTDEASGEEITIYDDQKQGISFEVNPEGKCVAIGVHKPGKKITDTYLPMFPDLKKA